MQEPSTLGRVVELVRDLRRRCPWDAAQTPQTLRPYLVEEAMELDHALATTDERALRAELGDVLLHVAFQIVLAEERGAFGSEDLTRQVERKMWARHPHLFPDVAPDEARANGPGGPTTWETTKRRARPEASVLDGLPPRMPALVMAYRLQEKAAGVGFDWPDITGPLEKIKEETSELEAELDGDPGRVADEIGDLLFAAVNLARKAGVDPRAALERTNDRFRHRFQTIEALAAERRIDLHAADLETLDALWEEAKRRESQG